MSNQTRPKLYFANNLGYSKVNQPILAMFVTQLTSMGYEVFEQFERTKGINDTIEYSQKIKNDICRCDLVFALLNGEPADGGVFCILGFAAAMKKPAAFFRDDSRTCTDSETIFANLMMSVGFQDDTTLQHHCYQQFDDLSNEQKFLQNFVAHFPLLHLTNLAVPMPHTMNDTVIAYLANYYGFSSSMKDTLLKKLQEEISNTGITVWEPFSRANDVIAISGFNPIGIANANAKDIQTCSIVVAVVNGEPPDVGVCFELGYAAALNIPCFLLRDDFRAGGPATEFPLNPILTMVFQDQHELKQNFCKSIESLCARLTTFLY